MVRQYYIDDITRFSEQQLEAVFRNVASPTCLLGGWAVHLHVNNGFQREHGRGYIGSRDIDVGFHVDPDWTAEDLEDSAVNESLDAIEGLGYSRSRFGFVKTFDRETGDTLTQEEAKDRPLHQTFEVFVDVIPDTPELDAFEAVFGFRPPAEPLLSHAFDGAAEPLSRYVDWEARDNIIPEASLLAAMKIRSAPDRDKDHKRVKDVADLHALLWYVEEYSSIRTETLSYISDTDLEALDSSVDSEVIENAAALLQIDAAVVRDSIARLKR